ncbi:MAG: AraC family transcriptional regulator [Saprospiraceae bacterium]|nr:AraC family transcriptional regulator [Saprospiraceae bacterium]
MPDLFNSIMLILLSIGCVQGVFFGMKLFLTKSHRYKNSFLAFLLLLFSYRLLNQILIYFGIGKYDWWYHLTLELSWCYGALIYLYIKASIKEQYQFSRTDQLLFIPVLIQIALSIFVRSQNFYWDGTRESLSWLGYWGYAVWMNYSTVPFIASLLILYYIHRSQRALAEVEPTARNPKTYPFTKKLLTNTQRFYYFVAAIYTVDFLFIRFFNHEDYYYFNRFFYNPFLIGISILTYVLSFEGYKQRNVSLINPKAQLKEKDRKALEEIAKSLDQLMSTQQPFKNPNLSLDELAKMLGTKPYLLSQTLKFIHDTSFYPYITQFRIEEFKSLLLDPKHTQFSLLGLAYSAGFNSKSSFNRAIKKHHQVTPSEFKRRLLEETGK